MIEKFVCNADAACKVASTTFITKTGAYTGVISQASVRESASGATAVDLVFKCAQSGELAFITLWVLSKTGERTFNHDILDALMAVLNISEMRVVRGKVFDRNSQVSEGYRLPELEKKAVGMLLQREQRFYMTDSGEEKELFQMNLRTPFNVDTKQIAKEILHDIAPTRLEYLIETTKDKAGKHVQNTPAQSFESAPRSGYKEAVVNEDIPFD